MRLSPNALKAFELETADDFADDAFDRQIRTVYYVRVLGDDER